MSAQLSRCVAVYSRHLVATRINAPAVVVAIVFTLDHFVTAQRTMGGPNRYSVHRTRSRADVHAVKTACSSAPARQSTQTRSRIVFKEF